MLRRFFAQHEYSVALIARGSDALSSIAESINQTGGQVGTIIFLVS
jgi:short-subunit dehydrogenase